MATNDQPMQESAFVNVINKAKLPNVTQRVCLPGQGLESCAAVYPSDIWDEFIKFNPGIGSLKVQVNEIFRAISFSNSRVTISKKLGEYNHIFYSGFTDSSGQIDNLYLPAPFSDLSNSPTSEKPYAEYTVTIEVPERNLITNVKAIIFDGVKSVQRVDVSAITQTPPPGYPAKLPRAPHLIKGRVIIPELIEVHLGEPDEPARNIILPFVHYLKYVASSTLYPTWPDSALRANIYAQTTFALNRVCTAWYRNQGYNFDITSSPKYDQNFIEDISNFQNLIAIVDELFNDYIIKENTVEPYLTQSCDETKTQCNGLQQWTSVALANEGLVPYEILRRFYGKDIRIIRNAKLEQKIPSYNGIPLRLGSIDPEVKIIQCQLNRISINYPTIPKIPLATDTFTLQTETAVKKAQQVLNLTVDGVVDKKTWYKIKLMYYYINKLDEINYQKLETEIIKCPESRK